MKKYFIVIFSMLFVYIVYTVISTSIESNLFKEWDFLASIPWMKATLIDFYINTIVIFSWMSFREKNWQVRFMWLLLFVFLGSIATTFYVLIQLFKLDKDERVINAFLLNKA